MTTVELNRSERIRAALFDDEASDILYQTCIDSQSQTCVLRLSEPAQMIKLAIEALINYQNDADLATSAVPELLKLLNDEDEVVVSKATLMVHHLSQKVASRHALINSPQMVSALLRAMTNSEAETTTCAASILHNLSQHQQGLLAIFKSDGISTLIKLLTSPINRVVYYALTTIYNLLLHQEGSKTAVRLAGGIQKMVSLLNHPNPKFLALLTECLTLLAFGNQESKLIILSSDGVTQCIEIMLIHKYEKLLWTNSRLLKVLSVCESNKSEIIQKNGIYALTMHIDHPNSRISVTCLLTLRNLSDTFMEIPNLDHLVQSLLRHLNDEDSNIVMCCLGIISNLTCNNRYYKMLICQLGGIEKLITIIEKLGDQPDILEPGICCLKHLTHQHDESEVAQNAIRFHNGISLIVDILNSSVDWGLIKTTIALICNLALCPANQFPLRESEVLQKLYRLLYRAQQERINTNYEIFMEGVKMTDIIGISMEAFKILARDVHNRMIIIEMNLIPTFVQFLCDEENLQQAAVGVLVELSLEKIAVDMIESEGATAVLTELLHSRNEIIATLASIVLYRMSEDKPQDYVTRLSIEQNASILRDVNNLYSSPYYAETPTQVINEDQYSAWYDTDL